MKEKILAFLKTKLSGVQVTYLEGVAEMYSKTITEESQIETTFNEGVVSVLKFSATHSQSESDRRATEAQQTGIANYEKKHNLKNGKIVEGGTPNQTPNQITAPIVDKDMPDWAKSILESNKLLTDKVTAFEADKTLQNKALQAKTAIGTSKLPSNLKEKWIGRINPNSETSIEDQVKELETEYSELDSPYITVLLR